MKVLILGGNGMLGHKLVQSLSSDFDVWTTIRSSFDLVDKFQFFDPLRTLTKIELNQTDALEWVLKDVAPDVVINAAGIIKQLPTSKDVIATLSINSILPHRLAELGEKYGFRLICISTDCVFMGDRGMYTEDDRADALDLYGRSKNIGEVVGENCLTVRTSIIGRELCTTHSMVEWFLSNRGKKVNGYVNAIYSGFPTIVFADIIADLLVKHREMRGLYHISSDPINKFELLTLIKEHYGADIEIEPFEDFRIDRSLDSTRFRSAAGFTPPPWPEMVERMAADPTPYDTFTR